MLADDVILTLLGQVEDLAGRVLPQLRGRLKWNGWLPAV